MTRTPAGMKRWPVTLKQRPAVDAVDSSFTPTDAPFTTLAHDWAEKVEMDGDEAFKANQLSTPYTTIWRLRYRADMDPELLDVTKLRKLVYQSREEDIVSASVIGRRDEIELHTLRP